MFFQGGPCAFPWCEVAAFTVVAVVRQKELWPDEQDFLVQAKDPTVIADAVMKDRHTHITEDIIRQICLQKRG